MQARICCKRARSLYLAATDENPRHGLIAEELRYMQDMTQCAVEHLEWARDRVDGFRGQRVVQAMATFIDKTPQLCNASAAAGSGSAALEYRRSSQCSEGVATYRDLVRIARQDKSMIQRSFARLKTSQARRNRTVSSFVLLIFCTKQLWQMVALFSGPWLTLHFNQTTK